MIITSAFGKERRKEMFYLTTHSTHFIYGYMERDIWLRTILIVRKETRCCHIGYSFRLTATVLLYAPSHRQDSTYHSLCYTSRGALAGMRNSSMGSLHEGSIWWPISPWANALTTELYSFWVSDSGMWMKGNSTNNGLYYPCCRAGNTLMGSPRGIDPISQCMSSRCSSTELHCTTFVVIIYLMLKTVKLK